jgi:hypothetical protein
MASYQKWLCHCGTQFLSDKTFSAHIEKNKVRCRAPPEQKAPLNIGTELQYLSDSELQLRAWDGDLIHKQSLRSLGLLPSSELLQTLVENKDQGAYLRLHAPKFLPPTPNPSDHTLGTYFEAIYSTSIVFRAEYILRVHVGKDW